MELIRCFLESLIYKWLGFDQLDFMIHPSSGGSIMQQTNRTLLGVAQKVPVQLWMSGQIDYSGCGDLAAQCKRIEIDYESILWRSIGIYTHDEVKTVFVNYLRKAKGE